MVIPGDERAVSDAQFLDALDLARRGLGPVRRRLGLSDLPGAKAALVEYFRKRQRLRWLFDLRGRRGKVPIIWGKTTGGLELAVEIVAPRNAKKRLYRDTQWLEKKPLRPGVAAPWVLDVSFPGSDEDRIETHFTISAENG